MFDMMKVNRKPHTLVVYLLIVVKISKQKHHVNQKIILFNNEVSI